jgi:hypothetical protein
VHGRTKPFRLRPKRLAERDSVDLDCISEDTLIPIGLVGFNPHLATPTIDFCQLFPSEVGLKYIHPAVQLEKFKGSRFQCNQGPFGIPISLCPHLSEQISGFVDWNSKTTTVQVIPWNRRTTDCWVIPHLDDLTFQYQ